MSLFQKVIVKKYLKNLSSDLIEENYKKYSEHFNDSAMAERVKALKEEQYQEGFLRDLFVKCLGYTINPYENFNLTTEFKNKTDAEKADGAILKDGKPIAVIELKSTKTKDLKTIEKQAFNYKAHQTNCKYVITSNFEKIRLYINDATEFEEFNVFQLSENDFKFLYLCLNKDNIFNDLPAEMKEKSNQHEDLISKKLYNDYSVFRNNIFQNLTKNNPQIDKLILFKKSQKLLDRFLFIFFSEDKGLIPPNLISKIIDDYTKLKELDAYTPLYKIFTKYFGYINKGYEKLSIDAYNGGLFQYDEILDNVKIDDEILIDDSLKLSNYDFDSEIDVNILGHIFEHSLNDVENITAELSTSLINETATSVTRGSIPLSNITTSVKKKSRRKKEGVFYTPNYITKYIVENTVGTLCNEKKDELKLKNLEIDETHFKKTKNALSQKGEQLLKTFEIYKDWLLSLKILDPACGSGAFLNQTLNFLIDEHNFIIDLETDLRKDQLSLFDIDIAVLENNLYGVDINEESVEIAKLSLWLKTAQKGRKLTDLSKHIKCGNSLIDDPEIAGEKAFDWNKEFPNVFTLKDKKTWHITTATHNSRYSPRMLDNHVKLGEPVWLTEKDEMIITEAIAEIIEEDKLNIPAYNICGDHLHMILVCEEDEMPKIIGKIKAVSARKCNIATRGHVHSGKDGILSPPETSGTRGHVPLSSANSPKKKNKYNPLWTQKFGRKEIVTDKQLYNTLNYIRNNRKKHELPENKKLKAIIDQMTCSIDHAFRFEYNGGFDVVIGNPPYVQVEDSDYKNYSTQKCGDLYVFFFEKGLNLLKKNGYFSFITPSLFIKGMRYELLRNHLLNNSTIIEISDKGDKIFQDVQMPTAITILINKKSRKQNWDKFLPGNNLLKKIQNNTVMLSEISKIMRGLEIGKNKVTKNSTEIQFLTGENISRYCIKNNYFLNQVTYEEFKKNNFYFNGNRLLIRETGDRITSIFLSDNLTQQNRSLYSIKLNNENHYNPLYVLSILNSRIIQFFYQTKFKANTNIFPKIRIGQVKVLPIKIISLVLQQPFIERADIMLSLNKQKQEKMNKFLHRLETNFKVENFSNKMKAFYNFDFQTLIIELKKKKIKLTLSQQDEWEEYFNNYKDEINQLQKQIDKTDKEIDQMVYELYGLTKEEIEIVEKG